MKVGGYIIHVCLEGIELHGSPLGYSVLPGKPDAAKCVVIPPRFAYVHDVGSRPVEFMLNTYDRWGNKARDLPSPPGLRPALCLHRCSK